MTAGYMHAWQVKLCKSTNRVLLLTCVLRMILPLAHVQGRMTMQEVGLLLFAGHTISTLE